MRILPVACLLLLIGLHYSTCAERSTDRARAMLGKALVRRARARAELKAREESKTEEDKAKEMDMLEDIFVGSGSQSIDKTEASGSRREDVDNNDTTEMTEDENGNPSAEDDRGNGTGDDGGMDSDASGETSSSAAATVIDQQDSASGWAQGSKTSTESMDSTVTESDRKNTVNEVETNEQQTVASSGSSQVSDESPAVPAKTVSNTQDTSPAAAAEPAASKQPESAVSTPSFASGEDATGSNNKEESTESTFKKSDIESSADSDKDDSGSTEAIRKGIESLSRLLTPVASGYQFELYSGDAQKKTQNERKEAEGESDSEEASGKGESDNADEMEPVKEKVCRRECHLPMTYQACAVPRCALKMGTIKDLCFWLCEHQSEVCEQKCEYIERD